MAVGDSAMQSVNTWTDLSGFNALRLAVLARSRLAESHGDRRDRPTQAVLRWRV